MILCQQGNVNIKLNYVINYYRGYFPSEGWLISIFTW